MKPTIRSRSKYRGEQCLNCSTPLDLADTYCHYCGQLNTTKRLALKDFFSEFFANIISYDSRLWRTISQLVLRPGHVTKEYCAGRRIQYANPFRFFLTVSIVFFLLVQLTVQFSNSSTDASNKKDSKGLNLIDFDVNSNTAGSKTVLAALKKQEDSLKLSNNFAEKATISATIKSIEKRQKEDSLKAAKPQVYSSQKELDKQGFFKSYTTQASDYGDFHEENPDLTPQEALKKLNHRLSDRNVTRYTKAVNFQKITNDPKAITDILLPKIPLFLFFFAPIVSLLFWLVYARGPWNYMEHMVFNFHLLTFIFLMMYLIALEKKLTDTNFVGMLFFGIIGPLYLYKALRKVYGQGRFKTILKFLFINFVFFLLLGLSSSFFILGSIFVSS